LAPKFRMKNALVLVKFIPSLWVKTSLFITLYIWCGISESPNAFWRREYHFSSLFVSGIFFWQIFEEKRPVLDRFHDSIRYILGLCITKSGKRIRNEKVKKSVPKAEKVWESVSKVEKAGDSVQKADKVCKKVRQYVEKSLLLFVVQFRRSVCKTSR